jgi:hypothetical protein
VKSLIDAAPLLLAAVWGFLWCGPFFSSANSGAAPSVMSWLVGAALLSAVWSECRVAQSFPIAAMK